MKEFLENCRALIGKSKLAQVFDLLENQFKDTEYMDEITQQKGNFNHLKKQERLGLISSNELSIARNKAAYGLLALIDEIKEEKNITVEPSKPTPTQIINIINSNNVNTGNVNTDGGDFNISDSN